jgi:hypothetical protein
MSYREFRRALRLEVSGNVATRLVAVDRPVLLRDIGAGGFLIHSPVPITPGTLHRVEFRTADGWTTTLTARAAHSRLCGSLDGAPCHAVGFSFVVAPTDRTEQQVSHLIDRITAVLSFD